MGCERIERPRNHAQFIGFDGYDDFTPVPHSMAALGRCTPTGSLRRNLPRCLPLDRVSAEPTLTSFFQSARRFASDQKTAVWSWRGVIVAQPGPGSAHDKLHLTNQEMDRG